jgi:hypothetical protein
VRLWSLLRERIRIWSMWGGSNQDFLSSSLVTGLYGLWTIYRRTTRSSAATPTGSGGSNLHASRLAVMQKAQ